MEAGWRLRPTWMETMTQRSDPPAANLAARIGSRGYGHGPIWLFQRGISHLTSSHRNRPTCITNCSRQVFQSQYSSGNVKPVMKSRSAARVRLNIIQGQTFTATSQTPRRRNRIPASFFSLGPLTRHWLGNSAGRVRWLGRWGGGAGWCTTTHLHPHAAADSRSQLSSRSSSPPLLSFH